jgi:hypothetical protein
VQYDLLAKTEALQRGLDRVEQEARSGRLALLCAEQEPLEYHRAVLVARHLVARGPAVRYLLADGSLELHAVAMDRLIGQLGLAQRDLFRSRQEIEAEAARMAVHSETSAAAALYERHEGSLEAYRGAFAPVAGQVGALFAVNARVVGLKVYARAVPDPRLSVFLHQQRRGRLTRGEVRKHLKTPRRAIVLASGLGKA